MAEHSIPVDLLNPGQVFACLGFLEAADVLLGNAEGGFDWSDEGNVRFVLRADGGRDPFEAVLEFLANVEPRWWGPVGYADPPSKKSKDDDNGDEPGDDDSADEPGAEGEQSALDLSPSFPAKEGDRMALPIRLCGGGRPAVDLGHWADGSTRDSFKLYAGNRSAHGIARAMLTGVRKKPTARQRANGEPGDLKAKGVRQLWEADRARLIAVPFDVLTPMGGSFNFDPRGAWTAIDAGYSPNEHKHAIEVVARRRVPGRLGPGARAPGRVRRAASPLRRVGRNAAAHAGARRACRQPAHSSLEAVPLRSRPFRQEQGCHFRSRGAPRMTKITADTINRWADDPNGPVALHLKQKLLPVEGEGAVIFPPTYAMERASRPTTSTPSRTARRSAPSTASAARPTAWSRSSRRQGRESRRTRWPGSCRRSTSPTATRRRSPSSKPAIASAMPSSARRRFRSRGAGGVPTISSIAAMPPGSPSSPRHRLCSASGTPATRRPSCHASCSP